MKGIAAVAAVGAVSPRVLAQSAASGHAASTKLNQFPYSAVELLDGPMREQFEANHAFFLALDEDSLLRPFRLKAGLPAPGEPMGGWYTASDEFDPPNNMTGYIPGHSFGQYLSALARDYAATGNKATQAKVFRLVRGFAETITPKFYEGYPLPCYTFDKTNCGLIDAHEFAKDPAAMPALARATDAVMPYLPPHALTRPEMAALPHPNIAYTWDESYTLPENFFLAYKRSGDRRYLQLAQRFLQDKDYFNALAEGENVLAHKHAYSHVNALSSASQAYLVLDSEKHLRAARNGMNFVIAQSFATGGWGPNEALVEAGSGTLGESLKTTHASFETGCGSYGHAKIVRYLMQITGESVWGDSLERVFYNTTLGEKPIQPGGFCFYYSDYNDHAQKVYYPEQWPCCSATFPQVTADYGISSYLDSPEGVYVNLFVPSRVKFQRTGTQFSIEQRTKYPYTNDIALHVKGESPQTFTIALRVPQWAGKSTEVAVDGQRQHVDAHPGAFLDLRREWKDGDVIEYTIDQPMHLEAVDSQHPQTVALMRGALTLFAINSPESRFTRAQLLAAKQSADGRSWKAESAAAPVGFKAFPDIRDQHYRLYHEVTA
ncbi:MAG: beta-L-arabinofuranosidase domain-containing protein [Acidobacteriaceae bacterium]